ncbi:hypothetical protein BJ508DRAFT_334430 [Ascobolus immersus RN42]|uniref:Uncharacterized protein n=1 Tax=Ascobolus immersus RN42 TaxID=1160509 RepID=A0A3N4HLY0_ASCIM|nr:hypothetical protein BJ508DRAFT_334430 [Ascobolus immersus RN42]
MALGPVSLIHRYLLSQPKQPPNILRNTSNSRHPTTEQTPISKSSRSNTTINYKDPSPQPHNTTPPRFNPTMFAISRRILSRNPLIRPSLLARNPAIHSSILANHHPHLHHQFRHLTDKRVRKARFWYYSRKGYYLWWILFTLYFHMAFSCLESRMFPEWVRESAGKVRRYFTIAKDREEEKKVGEAASGVKDREEEKKIGEADVHVVKTW